MGELYQLKGQRRIAFKSLLMAFLSCVALHLRLDKYSLVELQDSSKIEDMHAWFRFVWDFRMSISAGTVEAMILLLALLVLFIFASLIKTNARARRVSAFLSMIYAFFFVFGESFKRYENWSGVFGSLRNMTKAGIKYVGAVLLAYTVLLVLFHILDSLDETYGYNINKSKMSGRKLAGVFFLFFIIIILCWTPYAYAYYPGLTNYDFFDMLNTYYGIDTNSLRVVVPISDSVTLNNNNPVLQVMMAVLAMKIGEFLGSPYYGIAIFCYTQMIIFAAILSYSLVYMKKKALTNTLIVFALLFYSLLPWNPNFALTTLKDTNYSYITLLFVIMLIDMVLDTDAFFYNWKKMSLMGVLTLLLTLLRNNGAYMLIIFAVVLLLVYREHYKKITICIVLPILIYMILITRILYPTLGISPGSKAEMYSLPIQQIVRVIKEEGESIELQDKEVISKVLNNYDKLAKRYNPQLADPVKSRFNKYATDDELNQFWRVWFKYLKKYPGIYIQAAICDCFGYFYPEAEHWLVYTKIEPPGEQYGLKSPEDRSDLRQELNQMAYIVNRLPGIGLLMGVGTYSWIMFAAVGYLIYSEQRHKVIFWGPSLVLLLTVLAGPANTMPRYVYPIIITTPLLVSFSISKKRSREA